MSLKNRAGKVYELVGVGIGPANLSLAALLRRRLGLSAVFLDEKPAFSWHAGLLLPASQLQVHFLKDLVSLVDPTHPLSFPAFLVDGGRMYRMLIAGRARVPRKEFEDYYRWAADRLDNLRFGVSVSGVEWNGDIFVVHTSDGPLLARNLVSGVGRRPYLPPCAAGHDPDRVFHASSLLDQRRDLAGRRVAVIGGGQSSAEVVYHLLTSSTDRPAQITWGTRRRSLLPLDDSPFVDEFFLPNYSRYFHRLPDDERAQLLEEQKLASDGISVELLHAIYRRLYDLEFVEGAGRPCRIIVDHELTGVRESGGEIILDWRSTRSGAITREAVDVAICATGYEHRLPRLLSGLADRLVQVRGEPVVRSDFTLAWDGPAGNRIFVQNAARRAFGIADPNLSLLAWRSATIVNSLAGDPVYDTGSVSAAMDWRTPPDSVDSPVESASQESEHRTPQPRRLRRIAVH
jgi:lysine N6-hydroxylase